MHSWVAAYFDVPQVQGFPRPIEWVPAIASFQLVIGEGAGSLLAAQLECLLQIRQPILTCGMQVTSYEGGWRHILLCHTVA